MDIGWAVKAAKRGARVTRAGWNGAGMHVELRSGSDVGDAWHPTSDYLVMWTADERFVPWTASQTDLLAEDWKLG